MGSEISNHDFLYLTLLDGTRKGFEWLISIAKDYSKIDIIATEDVCSRFGKSQYLHDKV